VLKVNESKFLFITCVNHEALYTKCVAHIRKLLLPPDYSVELLPIRHAKSMAGGYNIALAKDAKYKIYLHQNTYILHPRFLHDILQLFQTHPTLGLLGTVGCKSLPPSGNWLEGEERIGKLILRHGGQSILFNFNQARFPFESVASIDGFIMATQYDIPWRADLFTGFHFYDASQSMEFIKKGYQVGIPHQKEAWSLHDIVHPTNQQEYLYHQKIFQQHYMYR
jgi:Glycosyltransferase like family